jgi:hypothetical protein
MATVTTPAAWLDVREPVPPPALAARLREVLGAQVDVPVGDLADVFLGKAEGLLTTLFGEGRTTRATALDLLCADALVTYAFEAACDDPDRLGARAQRAIQRISRLAGHAP